MYKRFPVFLLALLTALPIAGCTRQSARHLGEWNGKMKVYLDSPGGIRASEISSVFYFSADGKVKRTGTDVFTGKANVEEGEYRIDYSRNPPRLEIKWLNQGKIYRSSANVWFIGADKEQMHFCNCNYPDSQLLPTPSSGDDRMCWYLTKKEKK